MFVSLFVCLFLCMCMCLPQKKEQKMKIERKNTNRVSCNKLTRQQHTFYNYYLLHKLTYSHMYVIKTEEI